MPVTLNQVARQLHDMAWEAKTEAESLRESSPELWSKYPGRDNPDWLDGYAAALEHASKHVLNASTVHIRLRE